MSDVNTTAEAVERLVERLTADADAPDAARYQPYTDHAMRDAAATLRALLAERDRLEAEVASLRLTLGGKTFSADVPDPIGCPLPGACVQVAEIERLREALRPMVTEAALQGWHEDCVLAAMLDTARAALKEGAP
jgi:hypothetical protein